MQEIVMVRADERLVHGQILVKWIKEKNANKVIVVDNELREDPVMGNFLKMTLPKNVELEIYDAEEAVRLINTSKKNKEDKAIILVKDLQLVKFMHEHGAKIDTINIGRLPSKPGKRKVHPYVFLSEEDIEIINYFREKNIPIIIQMVPDSLPISIFDLI
ncbi:MAG TPA: PTS sugar transporter subunit IIB [Thermoanaerobacter sp.]|nr:PTS sugar transporter subunit IIB [Thermoanaerobacter sp.]